MAKSVDPHLRPARRFLRVRLAGRALWRVAWLLLVEYLDSSLVSSWLAAFGARSSVVGRCWLAGGGPRLIASRRPSSTP